MKKTILTECWRIACEKVDKHPQKRFIHFSFIVENNKILAYGINKDASPPVHFGYNQKHNFPKLHSEIDCYKKAKGLLNNKSFEIVNIRLNRTLEMRLSKPCACCYALMKEMGCTRFYFSSEVGFLNIS
jgi:tRNA(Arg) A34 adenosine deaminase TadA